MEAEGGHVKRIAHGAESIALIELLGFIEFVEFIGLIH